MKTRYYSLFISIALLVGNVCRVTAQTDTILYYNFATGCNLVTGGTTTGWTIQNLDGTNCTWRCGIGTGISQNNHSSQSCSGQANDWLISPPLSFSTFINPTINFTTSTQYSGGSLTLRYSTDYPGTGNPTAYTWNPVSATFPGTANVSLSGITANNVYFAFVYTSTGNGTGQAALWNVHNILIRGTQAYVNGANVRSITSNSAIAGAKILEGNEAVIERGIVWSTSANPTTASNKVIKSGTYGDFDTLVTGLPAGTLINYRGYARTASATYYTNNATFYTLAEAPAAYPANFTATAESRQSIVLNWEADTTTNGYIILQKAESAPMALPQNATAYTKGSILGDVVVANVFNTHTTITDTIKNLLSSTRYYFSIIPFSIAGANTATINYLTTPVNAIANDSTFGDNYSSQSDISGVVGTEADSISSLENTATISTNTAGEAVWKLAFRDGGALLNDADELPTIFKGFTIQQGVSNTIPNWQTVIQSAALFDDSTGAKIGTLTVNAQNITVSGLTLTARDNNYKTATLRLSLKNTVALTDNAVFHFAVNDASVTTETFLNSSQVQDFYTSSDSLKNKIAVVATKLRIIQQPQAIVEAGVAIAPVIVELTDAFNNVDKHIFSSVSISDTRGSLQQTTISVQADSGRAVFANLVFMAAGNPDTLIISSDTLPLVKSSPFKIRNAAKSDIIATPDFVYTAQIPYNTYQDSLPLTTANTIPVFGITVRDGGANGDTDTSATILKSLKLNITNYQNVRTLTLFDNGVNIGETNVTTATAQFSNLYVNVPDNGTAKLTLGATFKKQVTDNARIEFEITEALAWADTTCSGFATANAVGAVSSVKGNDNRINVTATALRFVQQPQNTLQYAIMFPAVSLEAIDVNNNIDADVRSFSVTSNKSSFAVSSVTQVILNTVTNRATFEKLIFSDTATAVQLTVSDGTLTALSDTFDVTPAVWYQSAKSGDWDSLSTWVYSTDTGNTWLPNPSAIPNALQHGKIIIHTGHTVTMRGSTAASRLLDETIIEQNAILIAPTVSGQKLTVNDGLGDDLIIYGTFLQNNNSVNGGLNFNADANVVVMENGTVELAANDYAVNWAGNTRFDFRNGSIYHHNTAFSNAIGSGVYFPRASANDKPVFRLSFNYNYPPVGVNAQELFVINGVLEIDAYKTVNFTNSGDKIFRNGIKGNGNLLLSNGKASITANAVLGGSGWIALNGNSSLEITTTAAVSLTSDKIINSTSANLLYVNGVLNVYDKTISGSASCIINGTLLTANTNGIETSLSLSGNLAFDKHSIVVFNNLSVKQNVNYKGYAGTLIADNPYGITLNDTLTIYDALDLKSGGLTVNNSAMLLLENGASVLRHNIDRFINGRVHVKTTGTQTRILPVGNDTTYSPVTLSSNANTNDTSLFAVEYYQQFPVSLDINIVSGTLKRIATANAWYINRVSGNAKAMLTLLHNTALQGGESLQDVRVATWEENKWKSVGPFYRTATATTISSDEIIPSGYFAVGVDDVCVPPAIPTVDADTACYGTAAHLTAQIPQNTTVRWYAAATGGTALFEGTDFVTGNLTGDTAFYAETRQASCISERVKVEVTVIPALPKPILEKEYITACRNAAVELIAATTTGTVAWQSATGNLIASGTTFTTSALTDTFFYAVSTLHGCVSDKAAVEVKLSTTPAVPYTTDITVCSGNAATLAASSNYNIRWFTAATDGQLIANNNYFTTAALNADTTFYAEAYQGACASERKPVVVNVSALPALPVLTTLGVVCKGEALTLEAVSNDTVRWFASDRDVLPLATGQTFYTGALNNNTVFFTDAYNGTCSSGKLTLSVNVIEPPLGFSIVSQSSVRQSDSIKIELDGLQADEYVWDFGSGAVPAVVTGRGPYYVRWTTAGEKTIVLKASNKQGVFSCERTYSKQINVSPLTGVAVQNATLSKFEVYPNPARELLNINITTDELSDGKIWLTDMLGKLVWEDTISNTSVYDKALNLENLLSGMYVLHGDINGNHISKKIIINK